MNKSRRNFILSAAAAVTAVFGFALARQQVNKKVSPTANARLGINLAGIVDWTSEFPFVDLFKQSRAWFVEGKEPADSDLKNPGLKNSGLQIDAEGWVSQLPLGMVASTIISSLDNGRFPSGDYVILYEGEGEVKVPNYPYQSAKLDKSANPGRLIVNVNGQKGAFRLDIIKTNPQNYIKNIRVIPKQLEATYQQNPWNPDFLSRWQGVACIRFMDFMATNNSQQMNWRDRPQPKDANYVSKGVPFELMIDLANRLNTEPWFCMPHQADDDYIKQFANTVKANLNPHLRAWVEYSNEVWNGGFQQNAYAAKQGLRLKLAPQAWEAACKYTAYRSVQIFNIWQQVFGLDKDDKHTHFVRVLAAQAAYSGVAEQVLSFEQAAKQADVLAISHYVGLSVQPAIVEGLSESIVAGWNLDQVFTHLNNIVLPQCEAWISANKKIADKYALKLVAYEAGQHLVGYGGAENNEKLTQLLLQANADGRMGEVYAKSLAMWQRLGGDLICAFNSVGTWSKWGSWGLLQYYNDKPTPKFKAVIDWANAHGQKMRL